MNFYVLILLIICFNLVATEPDIIASHSSDENPAILQSDLDNELRHALTYESFSNKHILDPAMFANGSNFTTQELNNVFKQRANLQHSISPGDNDLDRRSTHIFVIGEQEQVKQSFHKGPYTTIFNEPIPMTNIGISERSFPTILLLRSGHRNSHMPASTFLAWDCGSKYIVANLNPRNEPQFLDGVQDASFLLFPFPTSPGLNPAFCNRIP